MKKITIILLVLILGVIAPKEVLAFNYDEVNLSSEIRFPIIVTNNEIKITLSKSLKENNENIYYQFISVSKENIDLYTKKTEEAKNNYNVCKSNVLSKNNYEEASKAYQDIENKLKEEGKTSSEINANEEYKRAKENYLTIKNNYDADLNLCKESYNNLLKNSVDFIPLFDNNEWKNAPLTAEDTSLEYKVIDPNNMDYYVVWIKAKNESNEDIYNFASRKGTSSISTPTEDKKVENDISVPQNNVEKQNKREIKENPKTGSFVSIVFLTGSVIVGGMLIYLSYKRKSIFKL